MTAPDGTLETRDDGTAVVRFQRRLGHPIDRVWAALTEPDRIEAWLARAEIDLVPGGRVELEWLNTDEHGNRYEGAEAKGTISRLEPPRVVEFHTDGQGVLLWELEEAGDQTLLTFTNTLQIPEDMRSKHRSGWHVHLDFLEEALEGKRVDWPNWPRERWEEIDRHYRAEPVERSRST